MLPTITNTVPGPSRLLSVVPVALALLLLALPSYAATTEAKGAEAPDAACPPDGQCFADVPAANAFYEFINRIYVQDLVTGFPCGGAGEPCDGENRPYYRPGATVTRQQMAKFIDNARRLAEINITVTSGSAPIRAQNNTGTAIAAISTSGQALTVQSQSASAIYAQTGTASGVYGFATGSGGVGVTGSGDTGVMGTSSISSGTGVEGTSSSGTGVRGTGDVAGVEGISTGGIGVYGYSSTSWAGSFTGSIYVSGNCTGCAGPTRIDHPLDPENKYMYHSTVQSPDMKNVYDGNVTTDDMGEAVVVLPDYFEALNRDFRYQLTIIGQHADAWIDTEIEENCFTIKSDKPNVKVSWQVTGIRQDPYANAHRTPVEQDKPTDERGKYVHPTEWGQPESAGIDYEEQQRMQEEMR